MYMKSKVQEKDRVLSLRKKGLTYSEILKIVPVSKSSVSLWLKDSPLTTNEKHLLRNRREKGVLRGRLRAAASLHQARIERDKVLHKESLRTFVKYVADPLFQVGISLYWAEGSKRTNCFGFINSDTDMIKLMLVWIRTFLITSEDEIRMRVYTHKAFADEKHEQIWSKDLGIPLDRFGKTIYKTQGLQVKKRPQYRGCVRIELGKVAHLRRMRFWQEMLIEHYKKER